jgi:hypothetical protein
MRFLLFFGGVVSGGGIRAYSTEALVTRHRAQTVIPFAYPTTSAYTERQRNSGEMRYTPLRLEGD